MTIQAVVASLQVGLPETIEAAQPWATGLNKQPVTEPIWLGRLNLDGDRQADLVHHGGPHKAVCVYPAQHYPHWQDQLPARQQDGGSFGENFTVDDLNEHQVCIGDVWTIGEATVQVSQPRQPCWKLAKRWGIKDLALQVQQTGRTGWYLRVLEEGFVQAGMNLCLVERTAEPWTIARANELMHHHKHDRLAARQLANVPGLSPNWRQTLLARAENLRQPNDAKRLGIDPQ